MARVEAHDVGTRGEHLRDVRGVGGPGPEGGDDLDAATAAGLAAGGGDRTLEVKVAQEILQTMGFRVFVPLLALSIAAVTGHLDLAPDFAWLGSWPALVVFAVATAWRRQACAASPLAGSALAP